MNTEDISYYLFMECEELKEKEKNEGLTEDEKLNLKLNPYFVDRRSTDTMK